MNILESQLDKKTIWYFGNNRSKNLKIVPPKWYAPFFLTTDYNYAEEYSDYGVYTITLKGEAKSKILDFNRDSDVKKLKWPKALIDDIRTGKSDLNGIAYDMYILAGHGHSQEVFDKSWYLSDAAYDFDVRSENIFGIVPKHASWASEKDHRFVLQMWKDIHDAGFDGFTHLEFGKKILALFDFKCMDKISIKPVKAVVNEKLKSRALKKAFNARGQAAFPKIKSDDDIVFVSGISKDKALHLLKRACHDVSNFHPEYMEKAVKWSDDQIFGVFNKHDKRNVLAMASVSCKGDKSGAAYLHEMTGFIKGGYGKKLVSQLLQKFKKVYGQIALEGSGTNTDPFRPNEKLRDKFYTTIPGVKIYRVQNSVWNCPADFFYYGISDELIKEFLEKTYSSKQSSLNEDSHRFYDIDKNDEVVAKCRNPIGKIGISTYDDINAAGIGSFEIFKPYRRIGHAKKVLQKLVQKLRSKYDLVYCFVDKDNYPALSLYKQLGKVSNCLNANGQYEVEFWKTAEDSQSTVSKNIKNLFDEAVSQYMTLFGIDLSYMTFKVDSQPVYTNGEPCYEYDEDECAGDWTSLGWIRLNPDMKSVMDRYEVDGDVNQFTKTIIAHELAHEVWNNIADSQFKEAVLDGARRQSFNTVYLDTVRPSKLPEETFCEYLAHKITQHSFSSTDNQKT